MMITWKSDESISRRVVADLVATDPVTPAEEKRLIQVMLQGKQKVLFEQEVLEPLSLDEPLGDDGDDFLFDLLSNDQDTEAEAQTHIRKRKVAEVIAQLSARESRIIELRFGLQSGQPLSLQAIAERFGLTHERIRQIEQEALTKLRHPDLAGQLRDFIN